MKKNIAFIISTICVAVLFIIFCFWGIVAEPKNVFCDSYMATLRTKYQILKNIDDPKIIIVAGSSGAFSIDNDLLEKETGYRIANTALHAGTGPLFQTELSKANINPGDIVLLAYEWGWYNPEGFDSIGTDLVMMGIDSDIEMYRHVPISKYSDILGFLFTFANKKQAYRGNKESYSRELFDEKGNINIYRNSKVKGQWEKLKTITNLHDVKISQKSIEYLRQYKEYVESKGAKVYMIAPPTWDETVKCDYADFERLKKLEEETIGIPYISNPVDYIFPAKYMYDGSGMYHCSTEGTIYRTELIVSDLRNAGVIDQNEKEIILPGEVYSFDYIGDYQSFTALRSGIYLFEAWGG